MAQIVINEISSNYSYNIGSSSYATVALPITAAWGPGYFDPNSIGKTKDEILEETTWEKFPANQAGLEAFVSTYRGPATNYRLYGDYSYQTAITLLTAGYDVLVCRLCPGTPAEGSIICAEKYDKTKEYNVGDYFYYNGKPVKAIAAIDANVSITEFSPHVRYLTDSYVSYNGLIYKAISNTPTASEFSDQDPYLAGAAVIYDGDYYVCISDMQTPEFSNEATYAVDDIVMHNGNFYHCVIAVETAGDWNASNWETGRPWNRDEWSSQWTVDFDPSAWTAVVEEVSQKDVDNRVVLKAKYPGTFGNSIRVTLSRVVYGTYKYWNLITYIVDSVGAEIAVENLVFTMDESDTTDTVLYIDEVVSKFVNITLFGSFDDASDTYSETTTLTGGDDHASTDSADDSIDMAVDLATARFGSEVTYVQNIKNLKTKIDKVNADGFYYREWLFTAATGTSDQVWTDGIYYLLTDRLTYNPDRIISPWDDQDFTWFDDVTIPSGKDFALSPIHQAIMYVAYYSRCAVGLIDVPHCLKRTDAKPYFENLTQYTMNLPMFATHSAYFAPWGRFVYAGTSRSSLASPSFLKLMIERSQIANQSIQYSWALPTNRKHNVAIGKLDYIVPKKYLDEWQKGEGVNVNAITNIPDLGTNLWGNYTAWSIPPATYNALENLSTRLLVDAIKDVCYRVGISITFQYNNEQAYSKFYAGVTPILDTMRNVGAIDDYRVVMRADINGLDSVNANSVIGKVYITVHGVINDIFIDLIALPSSVDLNSISI